jgi:hypothetical protein
MEDDQDSFDVQRIDPALLIKGLGKSEHDDKKKKRFRKTPLLRTEVRDNLHDLFSAAENSNEQLELKGLPYRFHIYEDSKEVYISLVVLDDNGQVIEEKNKIISHQDFSRMIEEIASNEGLFFDGMA